MTQFVVFSLCLAFLLLAKVQSKGLGRRLPLPESGARWRCRHLISRPGQSQGLLYKHLCHSFIDSFIDSVSEPFPPIVLRHCHTQTVRDSSFSYKIDYVIVIKTFLNPEGHQSHFSG